jgi:hypothetical protein
VTVVVGPVTVTVTVFVRDPGHAPRLSPRRRCARTALGATRIVTSFFDPVRWHSVTFVGGFFLKIADGFASATDAAKPDANNATKRTFAFIEPPRSGSSESRRRLPFAVQSKPHDALVEVQVLSSALFGTVAASQGRSSMRNAGSMV